MKVKLSDEEKVFIIKNYDSMSVGRISQLLNRSRSTVYFFHKKWIRTKSFANSKGIGRSPALTSREVKRLEAFIKRKPLSSLSKIKEELNFRCHIMTISRRLKKLGFKSCRYLHKPKISAANIEKRLEFARKYSHWTTRQWKKVLFTDESSVELWKVYQRRIWRKPGEALKPGNFLPVKQKFGKRYLKMWSSLSYNGVGKLVFLQGRWNRHVYKDILSENLKEEGERLIGRDFQFQDDNDPVHKAKIVATWIKRNKISKLEWPPESSDLSPIENLWHLLKRKLSLRRYSNEDEFKEIIKEEWDSLQTSVCQSLIESMPRRLQAVISAYGGVTKY